MAFVQFFKKKERATEPVVSLWGKGQVAFNRSAVQLYNLEQYDRVKLYYDFDTERLGFEFTNDGNQDDSVKITHRKHCGLSFSTLAMQKRLGLEEHQGNKYLPSIGDATNFVIVDLGKPTEKPICGPIID